MKTSIFSRLTIVGLTAAIAFLLILGDQIKAEERRIFRCEKPDKQDLPRTYSVYKGEKRTVLRWSGRLGGKIPQGRCEQATARIQHAYDNDTMNIITNGKMNKQPVICTAKEYRGDCTNLLITLRPEEDSLQVLSEFKKALLGESMGPILHSGGVPQIYYQIDLEQALKNAPIDP